MSATKSKPLFLSNRCQIAGCKFEDIAKDNGLFKVSRSRDVFEKWIQLSGKKELLELPLDNLRSSVHFCDLHFRDIIGGEVRKRVSSTSLPTEFPDGHTPLSDQDMARWRSSTEYTQYWRCRGLLPSAPSNPLIRCPNLPENSPEMYCKTNGPFTCLYCEGKPLYSETEESCDSNGNTYVLSVLEDMSMGNSSQMPQQKHLQYVRTSSSPEIATSTTLSPKKDHAQQFSTPNLKSQLKIRHVPSKGTNTLQKARRGISILKKSVNPLPIQQLSSLNSSPQSISYHRRSAPSAPLVKVEGFIPPYYSVNLHGKRGITLPPSKDLKPTTVQLVLEDQGSSQSTPPVNSSPSVKRAVPGDALPDMALQGSPVVSSGSENKSGSMSFIPTKAKDLKSVSKNWEKEYVLTRIGDRLVAIPCLTSQIKKRKLENGQE